MVEQLVGQFLQSGEGANLLSMLTSKGLDANQAQGAVTATAQGAMEQLGGQGGGGLAGALGGMLGGGGGGGGLAGALGGMLGGGGGGAPAGGGSMLNAMVQPVTQFVVAKTGLQPAIASMVVSAALPKLLELIQGKR